METLLLNAKQYKKMIGHCTRFQENDNLLSWRSPAAEKMPPFFNVRVLITREMIRSRDVQCNTGE